MSTSLLYHAFGIIGYFYQSTHFIAGIIIVAIQEDRWRLRCPICRSRDVYCRGKSARRFRTVPIGGKAVFIDLPSRSTGRMRQMPSSTSGKNTICR